MVTSYSMNIGLFGGTFDPIHDGHLAVAHAAAQRCKLDTVLFVPGDIPPHKRKKPVTEFVHRYAMLALALQNEKNFYPSLLEAPRDDASVKDRVHYSIETVRKFRRSLKAADKLFFIIGIDAFLEISTWRQPEVLLRECEFIVVSRPGYYLSDIADALPASLRPRTVISRRLRGARPVGTLTLKSPGIKIHLLEGVKATAAATDIRAAIAKGSKLGKLVNPAVAEYIKKMKLYANPVREVE